MSSTVRRVVAVNDDRANGNAPGEAWLRATVALATLRQLINDYIANSKGQPAPRELAS